METRRMKTLTSMLKRLGLGALLATIPLLGGCNDNTLTWQEEVKLLDGRTITVTQKRRYEKVYTGEGTGSVVREVWLTLKLPEFSSQDIVWHENVKPRTLNVHDGKLYIVGFPPTWQEWDQYGKQSPPYIGFRYEAGKWLRIPFAEIPEAIYDTNLWIENNPPNQSGSISFADKVEEMRDRELSKIHKRVTPNFRF
jgi:hypothetical protein